MGLDGNGLLKTYALSIEDKMAAGAFGCARNRGLRHTIRNTRRTKVGFKYCYAVSLFNHLNKGLPLLVLCLNLRFEFNLFAHAKTYPIAHGVAIVYLKTALV